MKDNLKSLSRRGISALLALVMVLSLVPVLSPNARAADGTGTNETAKAQKLISITLTHIFGDGKDGITSTGSTTARVILRNGNPVNESSTTSVKVNIEYTDLLTGETMPEDVYFTVSTGSPVKNPSTDKNGVKWTGSSYPIDLYGKYNDGDVIYICACDVNGDYYTYTTIDYVISTETTANTRYARVGMQGRIIDGNPLGWMDYSTGKTPNTSKFANTGKGQKYTSIDGEQRDDCWFDIKTATLDNLTADGQILNLEAVQNWLNEHYVPILRANNMTIPSAVTISGPAYIVMYNGSPNGAKNNPVYDLLDTYEKDESNRTNQYASWGPNTKNEFSRLKMMSMSVPLKQAVDGVVINCYDIDNPSQPFFSITRQLDPIKDVITPFPDAAEFMRLMYGTDGEGSWYSPYSTFVSSMLTGGVTYAQLSELIKSYSEHWETLKSFERNIETGEISEKAIENREMLVNLFKKHNDAISRVRTARTMTDFQGSDKQIIDANLAFDAALPTATEEAKLKDWEFECGVAYDALFSAAENRGIPLLKGEVGSSVPILLNQMFKKGQIDLYYRNNNAAKFKVKVRINGTIDETMTREYPIRFNDKGEAQPIPANDPYIEQSKNLLPPGSTVKKIVQGPDEKPMPLVPDPKKPDDNVVIIDAEDAGYTVKIRINDVIDESLSRTYPITYDGSGNPNPVFDSDSTVEQSKALVPSSATIKKIVQGETESALPLNPDPNNPSKNIIIIDCEGEDDSTWTYRVEHYKDNALVETETVVGGPTGTIIEHGSVKNYPGYVFQREEGVPLVLENNNGVIKVFYKKQVEGGTASSNVKLYTDEYRTEVKNITYKSGYGFYAEYYVDVPSWFGAYVLKYGVNATGLTDDMYNQRWSYCAGGDPGRAAWTSTDHNMYKVNNWDVKATWVDGANSEKGKNVTVSVKACLNKAKSSSTRLCFTLPRNNDSAQKLAKAYIPVATKDGNNWRVSFSFTCNYEYRTFWTTSYTHSAHCPGHTRTTLYGSYTWYHHGSHTMYEPHQQWNRTSMSGSGFASVKINGSMYEDDFTGDRDKRGGR